MDETMTETVQTAPFAPFEWMLSARYLRARRKEGFISVIAGFSFLGIMLGVATLIIVMAVMNGFRAQLIDKILGLNLSAVLTVSKAANAVMQQQPDGGAIVNISSVSALRPSPGTASYGAAKAGVDSLTRTLAVEWGPLGIRTNAIAPGPIGDTEGARRLFPGKVGERLASTVPIARLGVIADIAALALFVLSDAGSNLNGAIIPSDGGLSLRSQSLLFS
jgi:NAD(P)-dependent dehydrogenase (short-subunit alcohol dehydrogenase family)